MRQDKTAQLTHQSGSATPNNRDVTAGVRRAASRDRQWRWADQLGQITVLETGSQLYA